VLSQFKGAVFDYTKKYRFLLWRFWDDRPRVLFVGLNPSTANELEDDPTVGRLASFAERWTYGGFYLCNVFGQVTAYPEELSSGRALHAANQPAILMANKLTVASVLMWGDGIQKVKNGRSIAEHVKNLVAPSFCFGLTQKGNPKHPLYLPRDTELIECERQK